MSNIFQRVSLIIRSNVNDILERYEDPEKIIDQCIIDAKDEYAKMVQEVASVKGTWSVEKKKLEGLEKELATWQSVAEKAVRAGNDDDARKALVSVNAYKERIASQQTVVMKCEDSTSKSVQALNEFAEQIQVMEGKRGELKSKAIASRSTQRANEIKSKQTIGGLSKFNEMAEKIDSKLAAEEAMAELVSTDTVEDNLLEKYSAPNVDDDLAALKQELGIN